MTFGLPVLKKRREILDAAELMKVEPAGMQLSKFTKVLIVSTLTLLYGMFIGGSIYNIINHKFRDTEAFTKVFAVAAVMFTIIFAVAIFLIIKKKRSSLVFTDAGIAGPAILSVKYEELGGYAWQTDSGFMATGQTSKDKKTLLITANKGWFPEVRYVTRGGTSVLASYGYFFEPDQMRKVDEIMANYGIKRLLDKER